MLRGRKLNYHSPRYFSVELLYGTGFTVAFRLILMRCAWWETWYVTFPVHEDPLIQLARDECLALTLEELYLAQKMK